MAKRRTRRHAALNVLERADIAVVERLRPAILSPLGRAAGRLGNLGDEPPLLLASLAVLAFGAGKGDPRYRRAGVRMLLGHAFTVAAKEWGKNSIARSRPDALLRRGTYRLRWGGSDDPDLRSFPSGHTAGAVALAGGASRELPVAAPAYAAAATVGALQVLRRAHFPGDVIAGAVVGLLASALANAVVDRWILARPSPG